MAYTFLEQPDILRVLFRPRHNDKPLPLGAYEVEVEVEPDLILRGRLYPVTDQSGKVKSADSPAILLFHGNGELASDYDYFAHFFSELNITLLAMDYRGYGNSDGISNISNFLSDAVQLFGCLDLIFESYQLKPIKTYVMGRSLGSAAALEVATYYQDQLAGLIIESGFANTLPVLARLGAKVDDANEYQDGLGNGIKISRLTLPTLIIHGQEDTLISVEQGEELYSASAAEDKFLVLIPKVGHNTVMMLGRNQYFTEIKNFVHNY
jgi:alpha-beta hydrolase superfamily lysophospholipase